MPTGSDILKQVLGWLVSNPQYSPGYNQGVQLGDVEFQQEIAPLLDKEDWKYLTTYNTKVLPKAIPNAPNVRGVNVGDIQNPVFNGVQLEPNTVYAIGYENAVPALWAHEFRHARPEFDAQQGNAQTTERLNRFEDVFHANTPASEEFAREAVANWLYAEKRRSHTQAELDQYIALIMDMMLNKHASRNRSN